MELAFDARVLVIVFSLHVLPRERERERESEKERERESESKREKKIINHNNDKEEHLADISR